MFLGVHTSDDPVMTGNTFCLTKKAQRQLNFQRRPRWANLPPLTLTVFCSGTIESTLTNSRFTWHKTADHIIGIRLPSLFPHHKCSIRTAFCIVLDDSQPTLSHRLDSLDYFYLADTIAAPKHNQPGCSSFPPPHKPRLPTCCLLPHTPELEDSLYTLYIPGLSN